MPLIPYISSQGTGYSISFRQGARLSLSQGTFSVRNLELSFSSGEFKSGAAGYGGKAFLALHTGNQILCWGHCIYHGMLAGKLWFIVFMVDGLVLFCCVGWGYQQRNHSLQELLCSQMQELPDQSKRPLATERSLCWQALRTYLCTHSRASLIPLQQGHLTMDAPLLCFVISMFFCSLAVLVLISVCRASRNVPFHDFHVLDPGSSSLPSCFLSRDVRQVR